ncbi:MAG: hypothetical protein PHO10_03650 [Gemmiger sp.]|nr:hypothetical protein [Gemmiger sp.]
MIQAETPYAQKRQQILARLVPIEGKITAIRFYLTNVWAEKHFSFGTWTSRQHVIVAIHGAGKQGFAESILSVNMPQASLEPWRAAAESVVGLEMGQALLAVRSRQGIWQEQLVEMLEMALLDLCGKQVGQPANHLLGLTKGSPVCGVHVILSDNIEEVAQSAAWAQANGKAAYIKVKLFGKNELDCRVIAAVRQCCPRETTYLIGDVNCGYRPEGAEVPLPQIEQALKNLWAAGLDACEDPAFLAMPEWVALQSAVKPLSLIPDYPLRPSRHAVESICQGMGEIYNIHPDSAGSILDAVVLAGRIRELGAGLMIGDDSLVGPSASIWQQVAWGLGARWVEATEKRNESDFYYRCVEKIATDSRVNPITVQLADGFGLQLNEEKLAQEADRCAEVIFDG